MAKTPNKIYFDISAKQLYDENGKPTNQRNTLPSITLTEQQLLNVQLVTDSSLTPYDELPSGASADFVVDNDFSNPQPLRTLSNGSGQWTLSTGGGTDEYYYNVALSDTPDRVYENASLMTSGTAGALSAGEFAVGDVDSIGENRLYVRLTATGDPDAQAAGWLTYKYADGSYTKNFIYSSDFNASGSWWDDVSESFRDPDITDGEISFSISANTDQYIDRILADDDAISTGIANTSSQINIFEPGTGELFRQFRFLFLCRNRFLNDGQVQLDLQEVVVYTKAEVDAIAGGKIPKLSGGTPGNAVQIAADGETIEDAGVTPGGGGGGSGDVVGPGSATDNAVPRFDTTTGKLLQDSNVLIDDLDNVTGINDLTASTATVDDDAYAAGWDADLSVPTKNAVYDEMETKLDSDFTSLTAKSTVDGTEKVAIHDGASKYATIDTITSKVSSGISLDPPEYGWFRDESYYGWVYNNNPGGFIMTRDTADAEVVAMLHMDGTNGDTSFFDDSTFAHTVSNVGSPIVSVDNDIWFGNTICSLDGSSGLTIPVTNFDPGAGEFGFSGRFYLADANKLTEMTMLHIGTSTTTAKVFFLYMDNGYLGVKLGTDTGAGDWTDEDSVEVVTAGYTVQDDWNSVIAQRVGNDFVVGLNGTIVMKFDMTGKTLNTPNGGSSIRFGHGFESGSADTFWTGGGMDEILLTDGASIDGSATGAPFDSYTEETEEYYTTKKYDVLPPNSDSTYRLSFTNGDLAASVLTVTHGLGETVVDATVYDDNDEYVIPDEITLVDQNTLTMDFSSFGALTGTYRLIVMSGTVAGGSYGEVNTASNVGAQTEVFKQKSGVDLEFRTLQSSDSSLDLTQNTSDIDVKATNLINIVTDATASRNLVLTDAGKVIRMTSGSANTVTIPTNASVAYNVGQTIIIRQSGAGTTTVTAASGVTLNGVASPVSGGDISGQYEDVMLHKVGTDEWEAIGSISVVV